MSKKTFKTAPKPVPPSDDAILAFEQGGTGHDGKPSNVGNHKPTKEDHAQATKRLSLDVPESMHRRFKTACSATNRKMVTEVMAFIEDRIAQLEKESGINK